MFDSMGVVEPVCENASDPFEGVIKADTGRELGVRLESLDLLMLVEKRRSHPRGCAFGVLARELSLPSGGTASSSAMPVATLALLRLFFIMFAAFSEWERPRRSDGRVEKGSVELKEKAKWSAMGGAVHVAVAVALIPWCSCGGVWEVDRAASCRLWCGVEERWSSLEAREKPRTETPMPAPDAQSWSSS
jgi:hypothetical protein